MRAVISLGGSVLGFPPNVDWLRDFRSFVEEFRENISAIVVGGGPLAREMMQSAASFGVKKYFLDEIGIEATLLNAWIVRSALDGLVLDIPMRFSGVVVAGDKIPVYGGSILPGVTTDFVAALIAEATGSSFVNITRAGGIYTADPEKNPDAELIRRATYDEIYRLVLSSDRREPGAHFPLDVGAFFVLKRSGTTTYIVGPDLKNLRRLFRGEEWKGTALTP